MCIHCALLGEFSPTFTVDVVFRTPANTGFDLYILGTPPLDAQQTAITDRYNDNKIMSSFRGGVKSITFQTSAAHGIVNKLSYTLTPMGMCGVQREIIAIYKDLGMNTTDIQTPHNTTIKNDVINHITILSSDGFTPA